LTRVFQYTCQNVFFFKKKIQIEFLKLKFGIFFQFNFVIVYLNLFGLINFCFFFQILLFSTTKIQKKQTVRERDVEIQREREAERDRERERERVESET